jgi:hypothetical protein
MRELRGLRGRFSSQHSCFIISRSTIYAAKLL